MKVGLVGLGRMGSAIAQRLTERGCEVIAWDKNAKALAAQGNRVQGSGQSARGRGGGRRGSLHHYRG